LVRKEQEEAMNMTSVSPSRLDKAMAALRRSGKTVRPVPDRLGYFFVDDYVKDAEAIIRDSGAAARH
jgi:hypothetical protein